MNYFYHLLIYLDIYVIVALGLNIAVGYCGLLSLAHASYFALGSYSYALATLKLGWGFIPSTLLGMIVALTFSLLVSLPAWRFRGDFFLMISLAVQTLLFSIFQNWTDYGAEPGTWRNLTNGLYGLTGISEPAILGIKFDTMSSQAALHTTLAVICGLIVWLILNSPWGRLLKAIRDDELAARGLGKNVHVAKMQAFAVACTMAAIAGSMYASYINFIDPNTASLDESILMLAMVLVGGAGNFRGPVVGALVLIAIPEILHVIHISDIVAANVRMMAYGLLLVVMMHLRPQGLAGNYLME